jgi:hypothetical protein
MHARTLSRMPEQFRVVAVTDAHTDRCREAVRELGCRAHGKVGGRWISWNDAVGKNHRRNGP